MPSIPTRPRTIEFAALDISAHPHPDEIYVKLFKRARKLRRAIKVMGDEYAELSPISVISDDQKKIVALRGTVYRFVKIDINAPWFDRGTGEEATDEAIEDISLPEQLSPNTRHIYWYFDVENHTLIFVRKNGKDTLSPHQAAAYFSQILNMAASTIDEVEMVDVTTRKSAESIERIFNKARVTKIELDLKKPNADSSSEAEKKILQQMEKDGAVRWQEVMTSPNNGTLIKSERISDLMNASVRLGTTKATTYDIAGEREEIDTKDHPLVKKSLYEPFRRISLIDFVVSVSVDMIADIFTKRR